MSAECDASIKRKASETDLQENPIKISKTLESLYTSDIYDEILEFFNLEKLNGDKYLYFP